MLLASIQSYAQYFPSEHWHEGYLVSNDGDSLRGKLKYDMESDLVQLDKNGRIQTFSGRNMSYFEIFDAVTENYRQFYVIPFSVNVEYKVPRIFEMLYLGELSLVSREAIVNEAVNPSSFSYYGSTRRLSNVFYFVYKDGKVVKYENKRNHLMEVMGEKSKDIRAYMKKNHLRSDKLQDLVRITAFYNSI